MYTSSNQYQARPRFTFTPALREHAKARIAMIGVSGSGKTLSALRIASALGQRIALICSERGSARKHAGKGVQFDMVELTSFAPSTYCAAIEDAGAAGYDVLIVDGLSQAWSGRDGALEMVDRIAKHSQSRNSFVAWREVTPEHNRLVDTLTGCPMHLICTLRAKTEYVVEDVADKDGKVSKVPRKIGLAPVQKDGLEYEFDVVGDMTVDHDWIITKDRTELFDGTVIRRPGVEFGQTLVGWLNAGEAPQRRVIAEPPQQPKPAPAPSSRSRRNSRAQPQPQQGVQPTQPTTTEPCFSRAGDWSGAAEWSGKPLAGAPTDVLQTYASVLVLALDNPKNRARQGAIREHRAVVLGVLQARMRDIALGTQAANTTTSDHTNGSGSGWDLSGQGAAHDDSPHP